MTKIKLEKLIKKRLEKTRNCEFKKAWIPKKYAVINIDIFSKEMAKLIKEVEDG